MKNNKLKIFQEIENVIENAKKDPHFKNEIKKIRDSLSLPKIKKPKDEEEYRSHVKRYIDDQIIDSNRYYQQRKKFEERYGTEFFGEIFNFLLLYDDVSLINKFGWPGFVGTNDLNMWLNIKEDGLLHSKESIYNLFQLIAITTPIAIFLHPYMNRNDIVNLIDQQYKSKIVPIQKRYRKEHIKIGSKRKPSTKTQEKRDFIYTNRDLKNKGLTSLVNKKFKTIHDYTYIHSILKEEIKKRK